MSEARMRTKVVQALKPLDAMPVENAVWPGTPDVNCRVGWVELKQLDRWPAGIDTLVNIKFPIDQRAWHLRRRRAGGCSWLLLRCGREWLLFDGAVAAIHFGICPVYKLHEHAAKTWDDGLNEEELVAWLERGQSAYVLLGADEERLKHGLLSALASRVNDT